MPANSVPTDTAPEAPAPTADGVDITAAVAENLRQLRTERNLSLDRLAERSGVSRAMLNQVENGRSTPTIALLWKIAGGLNVPFQRLIQYERRSTVRFLRHEDTKVLFNQEGTFASRALFPFDDGPRQTEFYELLIKAGGAECAEPHMRGTCEYLALSRGRARIVVGGQSFDLHPQDCLFFQADVPHEYHNPGAEDAILYLVVTYAEPVPTTTPSQ